MIKSYKRKSVLLISQGDAFFLYDFLVLHSSCLQQAGSIWLLHAGEVGEHFHLVLGVAKAQNLIAECLTHGWIQGTMLGKVICHIHGKHLCPEIAVVTCCITTAPYMVEIGGRVARRNLRIEQTYIVQGFLLEGACHIW